MRIEILLKNALLKHKNDYAIALFKNHWQTISYEKLLAASENFSKQLIERQIKPGERVVLIAKNHIQAIAAFVGIWMAKATVVFIDPDLPEEAILDQLKMADARFVIAEKDFTLQTKLNVEFLILFDEREFYFSAKKFAVSVTVFQDCDENLSAIIFTSGTTGDYKGVMLTHANFCYLSEQFSYLGDNQTCSLSILPLFHVAGLFLGFYSL